MYRLVVLSALPPHLLRAQPRRATLCQLLVPYHIWPFSLQSKSQQASSSLTRFMLDRIYRLPYGGIGVKSEFQIKWRHQKASMTEILLPLHHPRKNSYSAAWPSPWLHQRTRQTGRRWAASGRLAATPRRLRVRRCHARHLPPSLSRPSNHPGEAEEYVEGHLKVDRIHFIVHQSLNTTTVLSSGHNCPLLNIGLRAYHAARSSALLIQCNSFITLP